MNVTPFPQAPHWLKHCITEGKSKKPLNVVANVLTALESDAAIRDAYAFDEMAQCTMLMHPIGQPLGADSAPRPLVDTDVTELQEWLQLNGLKRIGRADV